MKVLTIIFSIMIGGLVYAQKPVIQLVVTVRNDANGEKMNGAKLEVFKGKELLYTKFSGSNGKVPSVDLPINASELYSFRISKDGYVSKLATINSSFELEEDLPPFLPFPVQVSLFQNCDQADLSFMKDEPIIKFYIDEGGFQTWDMAHLKSMQVKIQDHKYAYLSAEQAELYFGNIKLAEAAKDSNEFKKAIAYYEEIAPLSYCDEIELAIVACKMKSAEVEIEDQYQKLLSTADGYFDAGSYLRAKALYERALSIKPKDPYPKERIQEIDQILNDQKNSEPIEEKPVENEE